MIMLVFCHNENVAGTLHGITMKTCQCHCHPYCSRSDNSGLKEAGTIWYPFATALSTSPYQVFRMQDRSTSCRNYCLNKLLEPHPHPPCPCLVSECGTKRSGPT